MTSNSKPDKFNLNAQRLMVETTRKLDLPGLRLQRNRLVSKKTITQKMANKEV